MIKKVVRRRPLVTKKAKKRPKVSTSSLYPKLKETDVFEPPTQGIDVTDMTREQLLEMALLPFALNMDFYEWHSYKNDITAKDYFHSTGASNILLARALLGARTDAELKEVRVFAKRFSQGEVNDDNTHYAILRQVVKVCPDALGDTIREKLNSRPTPSDCEECGVYCKECKASKARKDVV